MISEEKIRRIIQEAKSYKLESQILRVLKNHHQVIINYQSEGDKSDNRGVYGTRLVNVCAYGLTKKGNPVIRAFQVIGHHKGKIETGWKFFRLDRILNWSETDRVFPKPKDYAQMSNFNETGDKTMSVVFNIANFNDDEPNKKTLPTNPRRIKNSPKTAKDITTSTKKKQDAFGKNDNQTSTKPSTGPRMTKDTITVSNTGAPASQTQDIENAEQTLLDRLKDLNKRVQNAQKIDLTQFNKERNRRVTKPENTNQYIQDISDKLDSDTEPITTRNVAQYLSNDKIENPKDSDNAEPTVPQETFNSNSGDTSKHETDYEKWIKNKPKGPIGKIDLTKIPKR